MEITVNIRGRLLQSRDAIELMSDKWRIPILHLLSAGTMRTGELQRAMEEISPKMLTQTLRSMERDGLIVRTIYNVVPPRVEYSLTAMGRSILKPLRDLCHWAQAHVEQRDAARRRYQSGAPQSRNGPK